MPMIFGERGVFRDLHVLPFPEFRPFADVTQRALNPRKMASTVARAEEYLSKDIPTLPVTLYARFAKDGNRAAYEDVYFFRRGMLANLALAEYYEGKGRFLPKLIDVLWAIMEETSWVIPAHMYCTPVYRNDCIPQIFDHDRMDGIDLFSAVTAANLALVVYYLGDRLDTFSPVVRERIGYELERRIVRPFLNCGFWWTGESGNKVNNWCPWINLNLLTVTAFAVKDDYLRYRMTERSMRQLDNFVRDYPADGGCDEGPGYWTGAGAAYFAALEVVYDLTGGKVNVYDHPLVRAIGEYEVKFNIHKTRFINFADCSPTVMPDGALLRRMGEKCHSEMMTTFGDSMTKLAGDDIRPNNNMPYIGIRRYLAPEVGEVKLRLAEKIWFPDLKVMAKREGQDSAYGLFVAMKGGCNAESHNHNDIGNVIVYYNGEPVLIDSGVGQYSKKTFSPQRYELWYMQSCYHNVADIGGYAQLPGATYASSEEIYDEATGAVEMELKKAYPGEAGIRSYRRRTALEAGTVTVTDTLSLESAREVDFHFLTCEKPEITSDGVRLPQGRLLTVSPAIPAEVEEFPVDDPNLQNSWHSPVLWRIHFRQTMKDGQVTFTVR